MPVCDAEQLEPKLSTIGGGVAVHAEKDNAVGAERAENDNVGWAIRGQVRRYRGGAHRERLMGWCLEPVLVYGSYSKLKRNGGSIGLGVWAYVLLGVWIWF